MKITNDNQLPEQERITVRQAYETLKFNAGLFEIAMQGDTEYGSDKGLTVRAFELRNETEVSTMLYLFGDYLVDFIDCFDRYEGENEKYKGTYHYNVFPTMTPVIWGKPVKKQQ